MSNKSISFAEVGRYLIVGGLAFLAESLTLIVVREFWLNRNLIVFGFNIDLMIATTIGFIVGLSINYALSIFFVFQNYNNVEARKLKGFIQFLVIGIIGLGLKALGMNFMVEVLELFYILAHIMTTLIVLVWNYMGRKILIFKGA